MVKYGFDELGLHKIALRVLAENLRAIRAYEKAGFQKEAHLSDDVCIHGRYRDVVLVGMIKD